MVWYNEFHGSMNSYVWETLGLAKQTLSDWIAPLLLGPVGMTAAWFLTAWSLVKLDDNDSLIQLNLILQPQQIHHECVPVLYHKERVAVGHCL